MGIVNVSNKKVAHDNVIAFRDKWEAFDKQETAWFCEDLGDTDAKSYGMDGAKDFNTNGRRTIGIIRSWYLYKGLNIDEIASSEDSVVAKKRVLNKEFGDAFRLPVLKDNATEAEKAQFETDRAKKLAENCDMLTAMYMNLGKLEIIAFDLDNTTIDDIFEENNKTTVNAYLFGNCGIDLSQVYANAPYKNKLLVESTKSISSTSLLSNLSYTQTLSAQYVLLNSLCKIAGDDGFENGNFSNITEINKESKNIDKYYVNYGKIDISSLEGKRLNEVDIEFRQKMRIGSGRNSVHYSEIFNEPNVTNESAIAAEEKLSVKLKPKNMLSDDAMVLSNSDFIKAVVGKDFDIKNPQEVRENLSNIFINDDSLADFTIDEATEKIKASLDVNSKDAVIRRNPDNTFINIFNAYPISHKSLGKISYEDGNNLANEKAVNDAIKLSETKEALRKFRTVTDFNKTGVEFLSQVVGKSIDENDPLAVKKAMESVYINGRSATDAMDILPKAENLNLLVDKIKDSMSLASKDFVIVMKPNSIEAEPVAVVSNEIFKAQELTTAQQNKISDAVGFVKHYRENLHKALTDAQKDLTNIRKRDDERFFGFLNEKEVMDVSELSEDEASKRLTEKNTAFNSPMYVAGTTTNRSNSRVEFMYGVLMSRGYSLEEILSDSDEMKTIKREAGKEFYNMVKTEPKFSISVDEISAISKEKTTNENDVCPVTATITNRINKICNNAQIQLSKDQMELLLSGDKNTINDFNEFIKTYNKGKERDGAYDYYEYFNKVVEGYEKVKPIYFDMSDPQSIRDNYVISKTISQISMDIGQSMARGGKYLVGEKYAATETATAAYLHRNMTELREKYIMSNDYVANTFNKNSTNVVSAHRIQYVTDKLAENFDNGKDMCNVRYGALNAAAMSAAANASSDKPYNELDQDNALNEKISAAATAMKESRNIADKDIAQWRMNNLKFSKILGNHKKEDNIYEISVSEYNDYKGGLDIIKNITLLPIPPYDIHSEERMAEFNQKCEEAVGNIYINGISVLDVFKIKEPYTPEKWNSLGDKIGDTLFKRKVIPATENSPERIEYNFGSGSNGLMIKDGDGEFKPIILSDLPKEEPKKVELLSGVKKLFASKENATKNAAEYQQYIQDMEEYNNWKKNHAKLENYNKNVMSTVKGLNNLERESNTTVKKTLRDLQSQQQDGKASSANVNITQPVNRKSAPNKKNGNAL